MAKQAIADLGLIGDGHCAALINRTGALCWLCWPQFDSDAIFASLLGDANNGVWTITPEAPFQSSRRYVPDTLILETRFEGEAGTAVLQDFMPYQESRRAVVRRLRGLRGRLGLKVRFAPRFATGSLTPELTLSASTLRVSSAGLLLYLQSSHQDLLRGEEEISFTLHEGEEVTFVLSDQDEMRSAPTSYAGDAAARCERFWQQWTARCSYNGPWRRQVVRSLITLKSLIYARTGAIVAAATTSLPEKDGGHRNWDYRFCWLRDSTFTVLALLQAGYEDEARAWIEWLAATISPRIERIKTFYTVEPHGKFQERTAPWLPGFNGSTPVRLGNGVRDQLQLGIYGEVQDTLYQWFRTGRRPDPRIWTDQREMLGHLESVRHCPDSGIWEQKGHAELFTQSRAFSWLAFDRAIRLAEQFDLPGAQAWVKPRDELFAEVCAKGFDPRLDSFTRTYGSRTLDGSALLLAMAGFLPADDPRIAGTVAAIQCHLSSGPFVYRHESAPESHEASEAENPGRAEGAFLACSFWLADNLILQGREDAGAALFEGVLAAGNDLGLYSEEFDVSGKSLLGNFPQALTHLSLVHTALNLTGAGPAHRRSSAEP